MAIKSCTYIAIQRIGAQRVFSPPLHILKAAITSLLRSSALTELLPLFESLLRTHLDRQSSSGPTRLLRKALSLASKL